MSDEEQKSDGKQKFVIGKNVIETLTLGMYEDSRFIYREYVQNAADQIDIAVEKSILSNKDEGKIYITIDDEAKQIIIEDNATGIASENALQFLGDVAKSEKDAEKRKGFRGIGRLGGLGYCEKLVFETSYSGEDKKSIVNLDAKLLKDRLLDKDYKADASTVIGLITKLDTEEEDRDEHYFKVKMENVTNEELLNENKIIEYLSMVAPLPFHKDFSFGEEIHRYFKENNQVIEEYNVINLEVNKKNLYKAYKKEILDKNGDTISEFVDVDFFYLRDVNNKLIAIGWYGISPVLNIKMTQSNIARGLRIKKNNITIGDEHTVSSRFFNEARFNHHFIGEIHVIGSNFRPNARRDYFNDNATVTNFENELKKQCKLLEKLARECGKINNRFKDIKRFKDSRRKFEENVKAESYVSREYQNADREKVLKEKEVAKSARETLRRLKVKSEFGSVTNTLFKEIIGDFDISIDEDSENSNKYAESYPADGLNKLDADKRKMMLEVFKVIEDNLTAQKGQIIQKKILEKIIHKES